MTVFDDDFEAITIDTEADEQELLDLYKEKTGVTLSAAHSEKILISIIAYAKSLVLTKINECVKNLLLPYASGLWLDILGYLVGCERLSASQSVSTLQVNLYESYTSSKTLPAGAKIETSDGLYYFETTDDLVIEAGETSGTVTIQSVDAGAVLNYGIGEVNTLVESYEFIESVENITACTGGADEEDDDTYRSRIAVAPEGNCATASQLETPRTIELTGAVEGSTSFDGSSAVSITTTIGSTYNESGLETLFTAMMPDWDNPSNLLSANVTYTANVAGWVRWNVNENDTSRVLYINGCVVAKARAAGSHDGSGTGALLPLAPGDTFKATKRTDLYFYPLRCAVAASSLVSS